MRIRTVFVLFVLNILIFPVVAQENRVLSEDQATSSAVREELSFKNRGLNSVDCEKKHPNGECILTRGSFRFAPELNDQIVSAPKGVASLSITLTFETNSAELTQKAKQVLDRIANTISEYAVDSDFVIEGHADVRGTYELNQHLSEARAKAVRSYLILRHGIDPNLLKAIGKSYTELFNKENPTAPENRRVVFFRVER